MSKKDEALKLALEALEYIENNYMSLPASAEKAMAALREALAEQPAQRELNESDDLTIAYMAGVHRGKELAKQPSTEDSSAVEQPAHQQEQDSCKVCSGTGKVETGIGMMVCDECHGITYTPPPAQQPVACLVETEQGVMLWPIEDINEAENYCEENEFPVLLYTSPPAQKKSAAWTLLLTGEHQGLVGKAGEKFVGAPDYYERVDVYTSPQRTWVGLTFGQFHNILQNHKDIGSAMGAVEKTLREQNT